MTDSVVLPTYAEVVDFIAAHFAAKGACDRATLAAQVTDDICWWIPQSVAKRGVVECPLRGRERILDVVTSEGMYLRTGRIWTIHDVALSADGAKVAVRATLNATVAATGESYQNSYAFFLRLEGMKVAEVWECFDSAYVLERFGLLN
jgi:ketosteroid isomerase-like protein